MPHIIVEHSHHISLPLALTMGESIRDLMGELGDFDPHQCKIRTLSFSQYFVGMKNQEKSSFIHVTIKILSRPLPLRQTLGNAVFNHIKKSNPLCDLSVDIIEMDRETYKKT